MSQLTQAVRPVQVPDAWPRAASRRYSANALTATSNASSNPVPPPQATSHAMMSAIHRQRRKSARISVSRILNMIDVTNGK